MAGIGSIEEADRFLDWFERSVQRLAENYRSMGYQFDSEEGPIVPASAQRRELLGAIRGDWNPWPYLFLKFFSRYEFIDFAQDETQRKAPGDLQGLGYRNDLLFDPHIDEESLNAALERQRSEQPLLLPEPCFVGFSSFASNCEEKGVWIPDSAIDPVTFNDGGGDQRLSEDLSRLIDNLGIPFWLHMRKARRRSFLDMTPNLEEVLPRLRQGLVPWAN